jgi:hypothetical protein
MRVLLYDTEEQSAAEDAIWEATYERRRDEFLTLREKAQAEIQAGKTRPMFDENEGLAPLRAQDRLTLMTIGTGTSSNAWCSAAQ